MKKKYLFIAFLYLFLSSSLPLTSQVVSVASIESKHQEKMPSDVTLYFENAVLDFFFNEGLILTSLPYLKADKDEYEKYGSSSFFFDTEPDYLLIVYFIYDTPKRYDTSTRTNLLPCKKICCKLLKTKGNLELYKDEFLLDSISHGMGIFRKVDVCLSTIKSKVIDAIRRNK